MLRSISLNLGHRLGLLRTALFRRFIYNDVVRMARDYGIHYDDVCAEIDPITFAERALPAGVGRALPDWSGLTADRAGFTPEGYPGIFNSEPSVARFLGSLVSLREARTVIELGCFVGWTTAHMALGLDGRNGSRIHALDASEEYLATMMANLRRHGLDGAVVPVRGYSDSPEIVRAMPEGADIIFLDTGHDYPQTIDEIQLYAGKLAPGGLFVLHDSLSAPGVRRSLRELKGFARMTFATEQSNGVTVLMPE